MAQQRGIVGETFSPSAPRSAEDTGVSMGLLSDLALKILYFESYLAGRELANRMGLPREAVRRPLRRVRPLGRR